MKRVSDFKIGKYYKDIWGQIIKVTDVTNNRIFFSTIRPSGNNMNWLSPIENFNNLDIWSPLHGYNSSLWKALNEER